jgi:lysophospholipase L1-like esterase
MRILRWLVVNAAVLAGVLIVVEGIASYGVVLRSAITAPGLAERRHTRYDELLGWSNTPDADIPDMYGPGIRLRINSQGFRSDREFLSQVPAGKIRVICSGDSFTLGYGVANDRTWCERLSAINPRLETVNMGQGGYGLDQAYLWYRRDGATLPHQLQILAFVSDDLPRVSAAAFSGYPKPRLTINGSELAVTGVPVPGPANPVLRRLLERAQELRTVALLQALRRAAGLAPNEVEDLSFAETQRVIAKLLLDLKRLNHERSSRLILVYLPTELDLRQPDTDWMPQVAREAASLGIPFLDLTGDFTAVTDRAPLFIRKGELDYPGAEGHYTVAGNELVAQAITAKIQPHLPK